MRTDKQLYTIFAANPQWIFELTGLQSPGECVLRSITVKDIEHEADGVITPVDPQQPLTVVEFQFYFDAVIYMRTAIELAVLHRQNPERPVQAMIIFSELREDPRTEPWCQIIQAYGLQEMLVRLSESKPGHPLVAVFQPIVQKDEAILEREAVQRYNQIVESDLEERLSSALIDVFINLLEQRFSQKDKREIEQMLLGKLPDLRETRSGQDLIQIGREEGRQEGREEGRIVALRGALIDLLENKFGSIKPQERERISSIDSPTKLNHLLLQLLRVNSIDELTW